MQQTIDRRRAAHRTLAVVSAIAVIASLAVASPATAVSTPSSAPQAVATPPATPPDRPVSDTTVDPARVPLGDGVEAVADARFFNPAYIISDYAFFNRYAMTEAEIQAFLDARIGTCLNGKCLNVLSVPTSSQRADPMCAAYTGAASESIARIIYKVQVACGVSAKAILVTLQKEQGLVTKTAPTDSALNKAMGYACPDTAPCDPGFAGVADQIYWGARAFVRYTMPPGTGPGTEFYTNYNWFPVGVPMQIRYHPNAACGTAPVTIRNLATASLYYYTPYTPNASALANLYGTGDACASYGNRNFWRLYTDWFGSPTTLVPSGVTTVRMAGNDRFQTAAQISADVYPSGASTVFVAAGTNFADGLAAAPAAAQASAPLLLVQTDVVPSSTAAELQRLAPTRVVIVGGTRVVSEAVEQRLRELAPSATIERFFGNDRFLTAISISENAFATGATTVFLATGGGFADALAASAAAGSLGAPVLLVPSGSTELTPETVNEITRLGATRVIIAGGTAVVSAGVETQAAGIAGVTEVIRLGGADRWATSALINEFAFPTAQHSYLANGYAFPDALSAAAAAGALDAPLHLSNGVCTSTRSLQHMVDAGVSRVVFIGGTNVLGSTVNEFLTCG